MILDPAPVSVLDEPYEKGLAQYNRECEEAMRAGHAKKLAAASRGRRFYRWIRRAVCCCLAPLPEEVPPVYIHMKFIPGDIKVDLDGTLLKPYKLQWGAPKVVTASYYSYQNASFNSGMNHEVINEYMKNERGKFGVEAAAKKASIDRATS